jgi:hypothetical protein
MTPDFDKINAAALRMLPALVARWLPDGQRVNNEWYALNPRREDHNLGSFKINLVTGKWADFAVDGAKGRDPIGLAAYLFGLDRVDAALKLAEMLSVT